jgi:glycosyltransferase involved in cell wall biosynthesis
VTGATGIARYITELSACLPPEGVEVCRFAVGRSAVAPPPDVRHLRMPLRVVQRTWRAFRWPRVERVCPDADIVHATSLAPPPSTVPVVVTVHDVAGLDFPELHPSRSVSQLRRQVQALGSVARVLAVSQTTADGLVRHGVPSGRITVTRLGRTALPAGREPGVGSAPYVLAVGELHRRKGFDALLEAFASSDVGATRLVFAGPDGSDAPRLHAMASALGLDDRVLFLGWVDDARLAGLYDGALALCSTSLAEGFGLPVVEAMARGVPVVATAIPATVEVADDAALLVPPRDPEALGHALERVVVDAALRQQLVERGRQRAARFTWDETARATAAAYRAALESG